MSHNCTSGLFVLASWFPIGLTLLYIVQLSRQQQRTTYLHIFYKSRQYNLILSMYFHTKKIYITLHYPLIEYQNCQIGQVNLKNYKNAT